MDGFGNTSHPCFFRKEEGIKENRALKVNLFVEVLMMKNKYHKLNSIMITITCIVITIFYAISIYQTYSSSDDSGVLAAKLIPMFLGVLILFIGIGYVILVFMEDRVRLHEKITQKGQVNVDTLTQAYNRTTGIKDIGLAFERFKSGDKSPAIISMDLDSFKNVNDTYGNVVGDKILKGIADKIKSNVRATDKLYRWGGDEFVLVCYGMKEENVILFSNGLLGEISKLQDVLGAEFKGITISAGVSYFRDQDRSYEDALKRADAAMYESKYKGKNRVSIDL